ncbi:MAG: IS982 family transposase [Bifidobacteriaceae bacterium]|jgi:hypothetical protein|nr:IS982 family transposase [Bifidobacteriaceae bacterium]
MDTDLDSLATALYVTVDDLLIDHPDWAPERPPGGIVPKTTDSEIITLAVIAALLGHDCERGFIRWAKKHLTPWFPNIPNQPGYNKRLRKLIDVMGLVQAALAASTDRWADGVWVVEATPVECGRSRETAKRSELAGWAEYGYCAAHSRYFWGLRLHLVRALAGLPVLFALTGAKADERDTLVSMLDGSPARPGQVIIGDKNYFGRDFEQALAGQGVKPLRKARKGEKPRPGGQFFRPLRQTIESVNNTLKTQHGLERHGGRTKAGVTARVLAKILALTAAIWHNEHTGAPVLRSLTAYDH